MNEYAQASTHRLLLRIGRPRLSPGLVLLAFLATPASGGDPHASRPRPFITVNRSPYPIRAVYACPPRSATWGSNLIEGRSLAPGQRIAVELKGGCGVYDLRFVADDGIEFFEDGVPFCAATEGEAATLTEQAGPADREDMVTLGADSITKSLPARSDVAKESR
jgi:hypothetical protein